MCASDPSRVAFLLGLCLAGACVKAPERADPPDVTALISTYELPVGTLDPSTEQPWLPAAEIQLALLGNGRADLLLTELITKASRALDRARLSPIGKAVPTRVNGIASLSIECGDGSKEIAHVAVTVEDGKLSSLLWGRAEDCPLWSLGDLRVSYAGSFTLYRYSNGDLLMQIEGTNARDGSPLYLDFRVLAGRVESRIATPTGDVIAFRSGDDMFVRAANGTFACNPEQRSCR